MKHIRGAVLRLILWYLDGDGVDVVSTAMETSYYRKTWRFNAERFLTSDHGYSSVSAEFFDRTIFFYEVL